MPGLFILNGYKFVYLNQLPVIKEILHKNAAALGLKGTILLSAEGMNINLAGTKAALHSIKPLLKMYLGDIFFQEQSVSISPFKRLKIKIKKEIITFRKKTSDLNQKKGMAIMPSLLRQWLQEKKPITLLDTRNHYEVALGTFQNAIHLEMQKFEEFSEKALKKVPRDKPIVMFCTGGIRCEKASQALLNNGYQDVYQLQGGILHYFKEVGGEFYQGECFVFDDRITVKPTDYRKEDNI